MEPIASITKYFNLLKDPRVERTKRHSLLDIIVIAICAAICGADDWVSVERFGNAKLNWLQTFLDLPNGIPSHDTFGRVFAQLDPEQFRASFAAWIAAVVEVAAGEVVAIDGKQLRRSHDKALGKEAIYMVSAWATAQHLVLGQRKVDEKSNEITAIPQLLQLLELKGCIVTIDAMGCQKKIAQTICAQGAEYVLQVKGNQGTLLTELQELFDYAGQNGYQDCTYAKTTNKGHGRIEIRECWATDAPDFLAYVHDQHKWCGLQTLVMLRAERRTPAATSIETRYYISSLPNDASRLLQAVRSHWGIENSLHWVLDVAFAEDDCRVRKDYGAENFALLRHIALDLLKQEQSAKCGIKNKRLQAAWDTAYLLKVLSGFI